MVLRSGGGIGSLTARLRVWWNWQTRYFEVVVPKGVQVQVLLRAPNLLRFPWETPQKTLGGSKARTNPARNHPSQPASDDDDKGGMFPMKVRFHHITVKVYRKTPRHPFSRTAYRTDGKRAVRNFKKLSLAKAAAEKMVREPFRATSPCGIRDGADCWRALNSRFCR